MDDTLPHSWNLIYFVSALHMALGASGPLQLWRLLVVTLCCSVNNVHCPGDHTAGRMHNCQRNASYQPPKQFNRHCVLPNLSIKVDCAI